MATLELAATNLPHHTRRALRVSLCDVCMNWNRGSANPCQLRDLQLCSTSSRARGAAMTDRLSRRTHVIEGGRDMNDKQLYPMPATSCITLSGWPL